MDKKEVKIKLYVSIVTFMVIIICTIIAMLTDIETTNVKIIGSFVSVIVVSMAAWKFPKQFYILALIFDVLATALGSVINLYKYIDIYDKFVHYLSGILLAEAGYLIIGHVIKKRNFNNDKFIKLLFSFFFSSACAGFWEIYEFTADSILKINMQGGNSNTMGDIISGSLGALTYFIIALLLSRKEKND